MVSSVTPAGPTHMICVMSAEVPPSSLRQLASEVLHVCRVQMGLWAKELPMFAVSLAGGRGGGGGVVAADPGVEAEKLLCIFTLTSAIAHCG